jgi:hypothetical protein
MRSTLVVNRPAVASLVCGDISTPANGNTFTIAWDTNELIFTWSSSPDNSGFQLPLRNGGESGEDYRGRLEEVFRRNETLVRFFQIVNSTSNVLRFRFREVKPLTITVSSDAVGMSAFQSDTGSYPYTEENLRALLQVYDDSQGDAPLVSLEANYSTRSPYGADFNLRNLAPVTAYLPPPNTLAATVASVNDYQPTIAAAAFRELYLRYADKYGATPVAEALYKSKEFYVLYGGSPGDSRKVFGSTSARWLCHSYYDSNGSSYEKPIAPDQPDYAFVFTSELAITIGIQMHVIYSDGTTDTYAVPGTSTMQIQANTLYCFPSGPQQMGISEAPEYNNKTAVAYEWRITNDTYQVVLLRIAYTLLLDCLPWRQVLAYSNGLGGIETVGFYGKTSVQYEAERDIFERIRSRGYTPDQGQNLSYNERGLQAWEMNSDYIPRAYAEHLRQLLIGETWLIDQQNLRFLKVQVSDTRITAATDDEELFAISIRVRLSTTDESLHRL